MFKKVSPQEFYTAQQRVTQGFEQWEREGKQDQTAVMEALHQTTADLWRWERMNNGYLGQDERLLQHQGKVLRAFVDLHVQRKQRGW